MQRNWNRPFWVDNPQIPNYNFEFVKTLGKGLLSNTYFRRRIMAEAKKNLMTYAGLRKLEDELQDLKVNKRKEIAQKIKEAREQGDLSENAEYDAAKDEQRHIEGRIEEIEKILKNAEVADESVDADVVSIGSTVELEDMEYEDKMTYKIVGSTEANSLEGKISNESPVGAAILHHRAGDEVEVETEAGTFKYKILSVTRED